MTRRWQLAALLAFSALLVGDVWLPDRAVLHGDAATFFPMLYRLPWEGGWDPRFALGAPSFANPQQGSFYPPAWLLGWSYMAALPVYLFFHYALAATGMWAWARSAGLSRGAVAAGLFYAGCGPAWSLTTKLDKLPGYALLVWVLWGIDSMLRGRQARRAFRITAAAVALMWLGGSVEGVVIAGLVGAAWAAMLRDSPLPIGRRLGLTGLSGGIGGLLAACSIVPFVAMLPHTTRAGGLSFEDATQRSLSPVDWLSMLSPHPALLPTTEDPRWFDSTYLGLSALALFVVGLAKSPRLRPACLGMIGLGLFLALGRYNPLYAGIVEVPVLGAMRYPDKWLMMALPFVGLLVAAGAGTLSARKLLTCVVAVDLLVASRLHIRTRHIDEALPRTSTIEAAAIATARLPPGTTPRLWDFGFQYLADDHATDLLPNRAAWHGLAYVQGRTALALRRPAQLLTHARGADPVGHLRLIRRTGADVWYANTGLDLLAQQPGAEVLRAHPTTVVFDGDARPHVAWTDRVSSVQRGRDGLDAIAAGDPATQVIGEEWPGKTGWPKARLGERALRYTVLRDDFVVAELDEGLDDGVVVLTEGWDRGWQVRLDDGGWGPTFAVDHALVGAFVPAGTRTVAFRYQTPGLPGGLALSLLGTLLWLGLPRRLPR